MGLFQNWLDKNHVQTMTTDALKRSLKAVIKENDPDKAHWIRSIRKELDRRGEREHGI
jgi:hypothetical protein